VLRGFRSPLLRVLPKDRQAGAAQRAARRLFISVVVLIVVGGLSFLVRERVLPIGPFYWLYWFHDAIYLKLKGNLFTQYLPWSLAWLGVIGSLVLVGWWTFVIGKSPLQEPHAYLVRWAARNTSLHPVMIGMAELFKRMGLDMAMMRSAVALEREAMLQRLFQLRDRNELRRVLHRFLRLSDFWLGLTLVHRDKDVMRREALGTGLATLLWVAPVLKEDPKSPILRTLNVMIARLVRLLPLPKDPRGFNEAIAWPGSLQEGSIALDTLLVLSGFVPGGEARLGTVLSEVHSKKIAFHDLVCLRLVQATEDRIELYETLRQSLETKPFGNKPVESPLRFGSENDAHTDALWREQAYHGLLLACHGARMTKAADLAARYLEAIEALAVAAEAVSPSPDSPLADVRHHALVITEGLPTTEIFRFAAQMSAGQEIREAEARRVIQWPEQVPGTAAYREAWLLSSALRQSAGTDGERMLQLEVVSE